MSNQFDTAQQQDAQNTASAPQRDRCGIIRVSEMDQLIPEISIEDTDTQGMLRNKGVFKGLHDRLLLPESYTIHAIYRYPYQLRTWSILVESPELPECEYGVEYPLLQPFYCVTTENGKQQAHLVEIKVEQTPVVLPVTGDVDWLLKAL